MINRSLLQLHNARTAMRTAFPEVVLPARIHINPPRGGGKPHASPYNFTVLHNFDNQNRRIVITKSILVISALLLGACLSACSSTSPMEVTSQIQATIPMQILNPTQTASPSRPPARL